MATQIRNAAMVSLLETDFIKRNEPGNALGNVISTYLALPGLRGFWPMASIDQNSAARDASAQGRTLTNNNTVTFGYDDFLPYAEFNGSTNYLSRTDEAGLDITGDLTAGCWVYFDNTASSNEVVFSKALTPTNRSFIANRQPTAVIRFILYDGVVSVTFDSDETIGANTWAFLCCRLDAGTDTSIFINDIVKDSGSGVASISNSTADFMLGFRGGSTNYMDGRISLAFLCAYALPDNMINNLYQQSRILFEGQ